MVSSYQNLRSSVWDDEEDVFFIERAKKSLTRKKGIDPKARRGDQTKIKTNDTKTNGSSAKGEKKASKAK
jgi:hypothetical protein